MTKNYQWPPRMSEEQAVCAIQQSTPDIDYAQRSCDRWAELQEQLKQPCRLAFAKSKNGSQFVSISAPWESGRKIDCALFISYHPDPANSPGGLQLTLGEWAGETYNGAQPEEFFVLSWCCFLMSHAAASWENWREFWEQPEHFIDRISALYPNPHPTVVSC